MTTHLFKLHFDGGLHVADGGFAEEQAGSTIRSDTLLSALAHAARLLYGNEAGARLLGDGATVVSSAFPFLRERLCFPKPLSWQPTLAAEQRKQWKKIRFVEWELVQDYLAGTTREIVLERRTMQNCLFADDIGEGQSSISAQYELPRIGVDRLTMATALYNIAELRFAEGAGLFFLARFADDATEHLARAALRLLGDEGIGADRTMGKGLFRVEERTIEIPAMDDTPDANAHFLLSLYAPTPEETSNFVPEESFYALTVRGGWVSGTTLRRKTLQMLTEGSALRFRGGVVPRGSLPTALEGDAHGVPFSLVRNAQAFTLPFALPSTLNGGGHE